MRILFLTDFYPPETNAAATRVHERARWWLRWGHEVTVVTSAPNFPQGVVHPGYRNRWYQREDLDGVVVVRTKTYMTANQGRWRRSADLLSFLLTALPSALAQARADVVVATSPNFFAGVAGALVALLTRRPFVLEIGDLWPAFVVSLGEMRRSTLVRMLERLEMWMYRRADRVVCLSEGFRSNLIERGVPEEKLRVVRNGVELARFSDAVAPRRVGSAERLRVGYCGNLGAAQGLEVVLDAAAELPMVEFTLVGDGVARGSLEARIAELALTNVCLLGPQPREQIPGYLGGFDLVLVLLRDVPLLNHAIPSKLFEAMAAGRPILLAAPEGEATQIVASEGCGVCVAPGDAQALIDGVRRLADESLRSRLAACASAAAPRYSRQAQAQAMLGVLEEVAR